MPDGPPSGDSDVRLPGQDAHHVWEGPDRQALTSGAADGAVGPEEDQEHLEVCPGYDSLWAGLGPMTTRSRVNYFWGVDKRRRSEASSK